MNVTCEDSPELAVEGVLLAASVSSGSPFFFLRKLSRLFFLLSPPLVSELVLDKAGDFPSGVNEDNGSATPKTCNAKCHNCRSFISSSGVRLPGLPGGIVTAMSSAMLSDFGDGAAPVGAAVRYARVNPATKPTAAPTAMKTAIEVQLNALWRLWIRLVRGSRAESI